MTAPPPTDLVGLPLPRLREALAPHADRPFRADQIYQAIHRAASPRSTP